jgi:hypothetical protein
MGIEQHAYGTVLGGLMTRRIFVLSACGFCLAISILQCFSIINRIFFEPRETLVENRCVGMQCYEVWTCEGSIKAKSRNLQDLTQFAGVLVFAVGWAGAKYGDREYLIVAGRGIFIIALCYVFELIFDLIFLEACGAYTGNIMFGYLANPSRLPPSFLGEGTQQTLRKMDVFPMDKVEELTHGFYVLTWYCAIATPCAAFLFYLAVEAELLSNLVHYGPLGLGVHFGFGRWDEVLSHEKVLIHKEQLKRSKSRLGLDYSRQIR